jgi:hypothetical protein
VLEFISVSWGLKSMDLIPKPVLWLTHTSLFSRDRIHRIIINKLNQMNLGKCDVTENKPGSVKYQVAGLTTKPTVKLP